MVKRILRAGMLALLLGAALVGAMPLAAHADPTSVVYEGASRSFVFAPASTDLFDGFKGVMPGDRLVQQVDVGNAQGDVPARLYLKAEAADARYDELLGALTLSVEQQGVGTLSDGPANEPGGLAEWTYLGTVAPGDQANLLVTLDVPVDLGNDLQNAMGEVVWRFKAEEVPVAPVEPKPSVTPKAPSASIAPQTGDALALAAGAAALVALAAAVVAAVALARRKRRD